MNRTVSSPLWDILDRCGSEGRVLDLWWRDDDAVSHTPALDRLLGLAATSGCPVSIAAIPARVQPSLVDRLAEETAVTVLTHGLAHTNHASAGEKPAEFGAHRSQAAAEAELGAALALTGRLFGGKAAPVLVPPWNRIAPAHSERLPRLGYLALSGFGSPIQRRPVRNGTQRVDTHLDPVAWRVDRSLVPVEHLARAAETALASGTTALGLLTHHLMFDEALWRFVESFLDEAARHPAIRFRSVTDVITLSGSSSRRCDPRGSTEARRPDMEQAA
ncbi:polysaccharide deacetylase [uncultured Enterovirga sp.]|uniref:polysaccharide deacetylase n=1 Tax=uncultured Enterovirga sp. TaxID=2026352 RepID=UPI0035C96ABF